MLDVILDGVGVLLLFGQVVLFLATAPNPADTTGQEKSGPHPAWPLQGDRTDV